MREWNQKVIERCRILPFSRIVGRKYEEAKLAEGKYILAIYDLESHIREYNISKNRILGIEESEIENEELKDFFALNMRKIESEMEKIQNSIEKTNEILNSPREFRSYRKTKKIRR